jgi:ribonuclease E
VLRAIEEEGAKYRAAEIAVALAPETAFYLFNQKRDRLADIEERYAMRVIFNPDATLTNAHFRIERLRPQTMQPPLPAPIRPERRLPAPVEEISEEEELEVEVEEAAETGEAEESKAAENGERKRRRRRRGKRREERGGPEEAGRPEGEHAVSVMPPQAVPDDQPTELDLVLEAALGAPVAAEAEPALAAEAPAAAEEPAPKRRRPRVGRRRRPAEEEAQEEAATPAPVYADIADIFEAAEQAEAEARRAAREAAEAVQPLLAEEPPTEAEDAARAWAEDAQRTAEPVAATPELAAPESEPSPESAVKPILVGSETTPAAKKSGWWRR